MKHVKNLILYSFPLGPDQTAPIGAVCSGSTLFASILNFSVMFRQLFAADDIIKSIFFLDALRVKQLKVDYSSSETVSNH